MKFKDNFIWDVEPPVSPTGQYLNSSVLSVNNIVVLESEIPINDSPTMETLETLFLPINPRFSSLMTFRILRELQALRFQFPKVKDEKGVLRWRKVKVNLDDHVHVPTFPPNVEYYDEYVHDYLSQIALSPLPQSQPLWDIHIIKYPTKTSYGCLVFKLHHSLGDGFTLMSALFSCVQRADDPSQPLTFPSFNAVEVHKSSLWNNAKRMLLTGLNSVTEFSWSFWKSTLGVDSLTPIRSGEIGVEFQPMCISIVQFDLGDIRLIKSKIGGTINDVICGVIFYGINLYMQSCGHNANVTDVTALVLLNTRILRTYQTVQEMNKAETNAPWGNHFAFLHVPVPICNNIVEVDPLYFVTTAGKIIKTKKNSLSVFLTGMFLEAMRKLRGAEETAKYIHTTLKNTSLAISNLVGPTEQMMIANHPVKSFHFFMAGGPQSLTVTIVSYMGKLKVVMTTERGFINSPLLVSCMEKSFQRILEAAG